MGVVTPKVKDLRSVATPEARAIHSQEATKQGVVSVKAKDRCWGWARGKQPETKHAKGSPFLAHKHSLLLTKLLSAKIHV